VNAAENARFDGIAAHARTAGAAFDAWRALP